MIPESLFIAARRGFRPGKGVLMLDNRNNFSLARRTALKQALGLGAALALPLELFGRPGAARPRPQNSNYFRNPMPEHLATAGKFHPGSISGVFDVRTFGATGGGKALDTPAINKAIEAAASAGGGTIRVPAGTYLCFSIHLKSNVTLYLDRGATIVGAETGYDGGAYHAAEPGVENEYEDFGHRHWHNALIFGEGLENVSILGPGLLWGKGLTRGPNEAGKGVGDKTIALKNCHNVTLRDFSILHGGHFGLLATGVDNLTIDNLLIDTNRDGMDIDCCRNVRVVNCTVNSPWDDGICPKSSYALNHARPTENLTLSNCYVTGGFQEGSVLDGTWKEFEPGSHVPRTGRIKFGTESNGGFKNVTITNCVFEKCGGLALESVDGALLEDFAISNLTMRDIANLPIFLRLGSRLRGPAGVPVGRLRRVNISNVVVSNTAGRYASILSGIPGHLIEDVKLADLYIQSQGGGSRADAAIVPPEKENGYPEPTMFGTMPAYGFLVRHVKGLEMSHVEIETLQNDARPAFAFHDVHDVDLLRIKAKVAPGSPTIKVTDATDFNLDLSRPLPDEHLESVEEKQI
jgi:polygalacturonase